jgi:hypothetical protein
MVNVPVGIKLPLAFNSSTVIDNVPSTLSPGAGAPGSTYPSVNIIRISTVVAVPAELPATLHQASNL